MGAGIGHSKGRNRALRLTLLLIGMILIPLQRLQAADELIVIGASVLSGARDSDSGEYLLHLQAMYEGRAINGLAPTVGASLLFDNQQGYVTLDAGVRAHFNTILSPFVGVGFFISDPEYQQRCDDNRASDLCEESVIIGLYPEAGLHLWVGTQMRISAYSRAYLSTVRGIDDHNSVYGINLAFTMR